MKTALPLVILGAGLLSAARADDKIVKAEELPRPRIFIEEGDKKLLDEVPNGGVIAGPEAWAKLWKAWGGQGEAPKVDFAKELVLVAAGEGFANAIRVADLKLNDKGDLKFGYSVTEIACPGITARLLKVSREGVKTVNGKELPKE